MDWASIIPWGPMAGPEPGAPTDSGAGRLVFPGGRGRFAPSGFFAEIEMH
jgi:hypothetical protein